MQEALAKCPKCGSKQYYVFKKGAAHLICKNCDCVDIKKPTQLKNRRVVYNKNPKVNPFNNLHVGVL